MNHPSSEAQVQAGGQAAVDATKKQPGGPEVGLGLESAAALDAHRRRMPLDFLMGGDEEVERAFFHEDGQKPAKTKRLQGRPAFQPGYLPRGG